MIAAQSSKFKVQRKISCFELSAFNIERLDIRFLRTKKRMGFI